MAHEDGTILAGELGPVAEACGQTPDQVRSCLRRLVQQGLFVRVGAGRGARFEATERGLTALGAVIERTRRAYGQDRATAAWDRHWRLVAFAIPEQRRRARDAFRDRLLALGGAALQGGLYVSPHPWHKDVLPEAERLGVANLVAVATSQDLSVGGERDPRQLARRLWPVDELARGYQGFCEAFAGVPDALDELRRQGRPLPDEAFLPGALAMAVGFAEVFEHDPLLPAELLPQPWPGRTARALLAASRRQALALRQRPDRPVLFRLYDQVIEGTGDR